ncbi:hypothetical protein B0J12DRAFT_784802 [Macrophomina phaseolina]|uniref:Uncharacterized protein n=1 Tax=Macrophomina phaseolina TaxID=35725 RepID=A0ABQ8GEA6_9PEZI|nr:hypothetical protein B0J12DRAFT_784802 [Macrophomina phaseolina]
MGSATQSISGSLFLGGYNQSRVISTPVSATNNSFISLAGIPLAVRADPGVPYFYLPGAACDNNVAAHLPVTCPPSYGLYPSTFSGTSSFTAPVSITLTLSFLIASGGPTSFFPCRPYTPAAAAAAASTAPQAPILLGRAFLQGAFLAQNSQSGAAWLAQAPGLAFAAENVKSTEV